MKLSILILSTILALSEARPSRLERRVATRQSHPLQPAAIYYENILESPESSNNTHVQYSSNWAGAVLTAPPSGQTFNSASAQFTIPQPAAPTTGSGSWSASAWVGIDGDLYGNAILQAGIDFTVTVSGGKTTNSYDAWYEWYPDYAYDFSGIALKAGDVISVSIVASTLAAGKVVIDNLTTGVSVTKSLTAPSKTSHLGGQNAEWIVEDFDSGGSEVPFANFGTVTFTDAKAGTASQSVSVSGATIIDIQQSGKILTTVTLQSSNSVKVVYV